MSLVWGEYSSNVYNGDVTNTRVGIDAHTDAIGAGTTAVNVYVDVYVGSYNYDYGDNQHIELSGSVSAGFDFFNDLPRAPDAAKYVGTYTIANQGLSIGGGPTYNFTADLSGSFNGATPSVSTSYTLPARPIYPPSAPPAPNFTGVEGTRANASWGLPADQGGQFPNYSWLQVGLANFGNLVYDNQQPGWNGRSLSGLSPNTRYYARVAAHNDAGWGAWSGVSSFVTGPYAITGAPTVSGLDVDAATLTWAKPNDPVAPVWGHLQLATDAQFTTLVQEFGKDGALVAWATSRKLTGLKASTRYYARVRASGGNSWGSWSPTAEFRTDTGAQMPIDGVLTQVIPHGRVNGEWQRAKINKHVAGAWVI